MEGIRTTEVIGVGAWFAPTEDNLVKQLVFGVYIFEYFIFTHMYQNQH